MTEDFFRFAIGIAVLLVSTQKLVDLAKKVSRSLRISPLIVGITIVAIGTSLPELTVSIISILRQDPGLAMGNIIGSNVVNVLMVLPAGLLIGKMRIGTTKTQQNALILLFITIIFYLCQIIPGINMISGSGLIFLSVAVSFMEYKFAIFGRTHEDARQFKAGKIKKPEFGLFFYGILLVSGIITGGIFVVEAVETISRITGLSTTILGLTLTAVATSLPELLTTIFSQSGNQEKLTVGTILGSNIYNLTLIGGIILLFHPASIIQAGEWLWLGFTTVGLVGFIRYYSGQKPPKWIGFLLIVLLGIYLATQ
jgi:cation:H+ antiporter